MERPLSNRPWYKRWTVLGLILFGGTKGAEAGGIVPAGTAEQAVEALSALGAVLATLGVYRHVAN